MYAIIIRFGSFGTSVLAEFAKRACWMVLAASSLPVLQGGTAAQGQGGASDLGRASHEAASIREARISPDGSSVVFAAERDPAGTVELYCVPLEGGRSPIHVGGPLLSSGGYSWEIGPGRRVVFLGPELASIALDGGSDPVRLGDPAATARDFVLSPDGTRVVYRAAPPDRHAGLYSAAVDGSTPPVELVAPNDRGEVEHNYQVSRDGDTVVFLSHHEDGASAKLYSTPIGGGPVVVLDPPHFGIHDFRISPDGSLVAYRCSRGASDIKELYTVPIDGIRGPARLDVPPGGVGDVVDFEFSSDGGLIVYLADRGDGRNRMFSVLADGSAFPTELAGDVTSSFQIHPAGDLVLYLADHEQDEQFELRGARIDGSAVPSVLSAPLSSPGHVGWFAVTPDGTGLVYQAHRAGDQGGWLSELWRVSLVDGTRTRLAETGAGRDLRLTSGRILYRDGGTLYGLALDGGSSPLALAPDLAPDEFLVSPDGSRAVYRSAADGGLASVRTDGGPSVQLAPFARAPGAAGPPPGSQASSAAGGFRDFSFGNSGVAAPTGEKPESKLWWNDGSWWASLYVDAAQDYHIHRLDAASQGWVDTGTVLDERAATNADVLWDGATQKLYVASHVFTTTAGPSATASTWGGLFRYSYSSTAKSYARDAGFPVAITRGTAEALTIAKDSQGQLWATWVESSQVMVNRSLASDSDWGTPFVLPASQAAVSVSDDDICSIIAFGGDRIGVMWSNQLNTNVYFAVHRDADQDTLWQQEEVVLSGADCSGLCADDHINLKADSAGRVLAVLKTSVTEPNDTLTMVVGRGPNGGWGSTPFGTKNDNHTRPILLLDEQHGRAHVFATSPTGGGTIYHKSASLADLRFDPGVGTPFIQNSTDQAINNATSTKQNVDDRTNLVVLASDETTRFYLHNFLVLGSAGNPPTIGSFSPTSGPVGTNVTITGTGFDGATSVRFNGTQASFGVVSGTQIRATVPAGATTGPISVTTPDGTATSSGVFNVTQPPGAPTIGSFSPTRGAVGTIVTITGTSLGGTTGVRFNGTAAVFVVDSSTQVRAMVPDGATTGRISVTTPGGTATSTGAFTVTQPPVIFSFSPTSGPAGANVTVTGAGLSGASSVQFNGAPASFSVASDTQIRATVPAGATSGKISVVTPGGTATSATSFQVSQPPVITSFLPPAGLALIPVTITGRSFAGASSVKFNGKSAQFTVLSNELILATVPLGATTGRITVTTASGTGTSAQDFVVIGL